MSTPNLNLNAGGPLTDEEFDRLDEILETRTQGRAMALEALDGFFAALIAGPEIVMPSEYLPIVFGDTKSDFCKFASMDEANEALSLLMRHWNTIASTLSSDDIYSPLLFEDENGVSQGNDWAAGFLNGVAMRNEGWSELANADEYGGCLLPAMILCHEHDDDPELRSPPIPPEKRDELIAYMAAGVMLAYQYFREGWPDEGQSKSASKSARSKAKVGPNERCPCGSGKKYKKCCGSATKN